MKLVGFYSNKCFGLKRAKSTKIARKKRKQLSIIKLSCDFLVAGAERIELPRTVLEFYVLYFEPIYIELNSI